jgi:hypothetical protein
MFHHATEANVEMEALTGVGLVMGTDEIQAN